jgi:hypothetical protein
MDSRVPLAVVLCLAMSTGCAACGKYGNIDGAAATTGDGLRNSPCQEDLWAVCGMAAFPTHRKGDFEARLCLAVRIGPVLLCLEPV